MRRGGAPLPGALPAWAPSLPFALVPMASHELRVTGSSGPGPSLFGSGLSGTLRGRLMVKERVQVRECRDALRGILRAALCAVSSLIAVP